MIKPIQAGDFIPDFSVKDQYGNIFDTRNYRGKKPLAIIFYPLFGNNGCERGDCSSRDLTERLKEAGVELLGISGQSPDRLKDSTGSNGPGFPIFVDQDHKLRKLFGIHPLRMGKYGPMFSLAFGVNAGRITFITNTEGKIIYKTGSRIQSKCQSDEVNKIYLILEEKIFIRS
jgi:peroxiredoxin Q/BCP